MCRLCHCSMHRPWISRFHNNSDLKDLDIVIHAIKLRDMEWSVPGNWLKLYVRSLCSKCFSFGTFFPLLMHIAQYPVPVYLVITKNYFSQQALTVGHGSSLWVSWNEAATCCDMTCLHFTNWSHLRTPWQFLEKTCDASFHIHCLQGCTWKISCNVTALYILRIFANLEGHQEHQSCIECANFFWCNLFPGVKAKATPWLHDAGSLAGFTQSF